MLSSQASGPRQYTYSARNGIHQKIISNAFHEAALRVKARDLEDEGDFDVMLPITVGLAVAMRRNFPRAGSKTVLNGMLQRFPC